MIDQITLEMWLADFRAAESWDDLGYEPSDVARVLSNMGALREIVEELAERPAVQYVKAGTRDAHYVCSFCRRVNWNNQNIDHDESCLWAQARALVGPASGARTEES